MGGLGSGRRYRYGTKQTVEDCRRLDVRYLQKKGYLTANNLASLAWRDVTVKETSSLLLVISETHVRLVYHSRRGEEAWKDIEETVPLVWTSCHYGGNRPWFLCPGVVNGRSCRRRVAIL